LRVVIVIGVSVYMDASSSHSVDVFWNRQGNTDKWPEIVCVLLFLRVLLAVHLFEALFGQHVHHVEHDGLLGALSGHDNSEPELGWDTEAEDTVDVGADDLEVHEGDEEFFVSILCSLMHGGATVFKRCFELSALLLVLIELLLVVEEFAGSVTGLADSFDGIVELVLVHNDTVDLVLVLIHHVKFLYRVGDDNTGNSPGHLLLELALLLRRHHGNSRVPEALVLTIGIILELSDLLLVVLHDFRGVEANSFKEVCLGFLILSLFHLGDSELSVVREPLPLTIIELLVVFLHHLGNFSMEECSLS